MSRGTFSAYVQIIIARYSNQNENHEPITNNIHETWFNYTKVVTATSNTISIQLNAYQWKGTNAFVYQNVLDIK